MKRKLPALVLALAIVISAFGLVPAAAASTDSNTELAMAVLEGLGAFDNGEMTSSDTIAANLQGCSLTRSVRAAKRAHMSAAQCTPTSRPAATTPVTSTL